CDQWRKVEMRRRAPQHQSPYCEAATPGPQPFLRRCPPLVMRIVASMTNRGWCRTDEASRSQDLDLSSRSKVCRASEDHPVSAVSGSAPLTLRSAAACYRLSLQALA